MSRYECNNVENIDMNIKNVLNNLIIQNFKNFITDQIDNTYYNI